MRTKSIVIVAALIAAGTVALVGQHLHAAIEVGQVAVPPPAIPVVAGTVLQSDVPIYLRGVGTVIAYNNVIVRSQLTGQVVKIAFNQGQTVHQGDLLAEIDPRPYQAQLDQAIAN